MKKMLARSLVLVVVVVLLSACNSSVLISHMYCPSDPNIWFTVEDSPVGYEFVCGNNHEATWKFKDGSLITGMAKVDSYVPSEMGISFEFYLTDETHTRALLDNCTLNWETDRLISSPLVIDIEKETKLWSENKIAQMFGQMDDVFVKCSISDRPIQMTAIFKPQSTWAVSK